MVEFNSIFVKPVAVYLSSFSECFCCDNSCNLFRKIGVIWSKSKSFHRNFIKICTEWWIILPFLLANSEIQSSLGGLTIQSESCQSVRSFVCLWKAKYMMSDSLSCNPHLTTPCVLCEVYGINDMINMNRKFFWLFGNSSEYQKKHFIKNQTNKNVWEIINLCCKQNERNFFKEFARQKIIISILLNSCLGWQDWWTKNYKKAYAGALWVLRIIHIYYT